MIKKIPLVNLLSMSLVLGASISCSENQSHSMEDFEQTATLKIKALATNLKKELSASMQAGGPIASIETCRIKAPELTDLLNNTDELKIKRTSLRLRNPNNAADSWEQKVLASFEQKFSSGTPIKELVHSEKFTIGDQTTLRMMRAIPMKPVCLNCHGSKKTMSNDLISALQQNYPNDLASGFSIGEIRGAFSVSQTINH